MTGKTHLIVACLLWLLLPCCALAFDIEAQLSHSIIHSSNHNFSTDRLPARSSRSSADLNGTWRNLYTIIQSNLTLSRLVERAEADVSRNLYSANIDVKKTFASTHSGKLQISHTQGLIKDQAGEDTDSYGNQLKYYQEALFAGMAIDSSPRTSLLLAFDGQQKRYQDTSLVDYQNLGLIIGLLHKPTPVALLTTKLFTQKLLYSGKDSMSTTAVGGEFIVESKLSEQTELKGDISYSVRSSDDTTRSEGALHGGVTYTINTQADTHSASYSHKRLPTGLGSEKDIDKLVLSIEKGIGNKMRYSLTGIAQKTTLIDDNKHHEYKRAAQLAFHDASIKDWKLSLQIQHEQRKESDYWIKSNKVMLSINYIIN